MIISNLLTCHHRWMMRYLAKRGWVVFYWPSESRHECKDGMCVWNLYLMSEANDAR